MFKLIKFTIKRTLKSEKRAREAELSLKNLEDKITFKKVVLENGKTKITREEPKDFSRIIAANLISSTNIKTTKMSNNNRFVISALGLFGAFIYNSFLDKKEKKLQKLQKDLKDKDEDLEDKDKELEGKWRQNKDYFDGLRVGYVANLEKLKFSESKIEENFSDKDEYKKYKKSSQKIFKEAKEKELDKIREEEEEEFVSSLGPGLF